MSAKIRVLEKLCGTINTCLSVATLGCNCLGKSNRGVISQNVLVAGGCRQNEKGTFLRRVELRVIVGLIDRYRWTTHFCET